MLAEQPGQSAQPEQHPRPEQAQEPERGEKPSPSPPAALYRAPMASVAMAMAAGIAAGRYVALPAGAWAIWGGAGLLAAALAGRRRRLAGSLAVAAAIFALAAAHVRIAAFRLGEDHVVTYSDRVTTLATLRGRIAASPSVHRLDAALSYPREPVTSFVLAAEALRGADGKAYLPADGLVQVTVQEPDRRLRRGQRVELVGSLSRYRPPANPGQRDVAAEARRMGKLARFRVPGADGVTILAEATGGWLRRLRDRAGAWAGDHLRGAAPGEAGLLLEALIVGRRDPALDGLRRTMVRAGIAHLFSISGMHLGIFLGFVYLLCRLAALSPRFSAVAALACLAGYLLLAEPRSPLLRSAVMAAALCLATILRRRRAALNALAVAAVALLAADPMVLFETGFQLSFTIVAGLIVLTRPFRDLLFGRWRRRRGLMVFRNDQRVRRWLSFTLADWLMNAAAMSLLAYLLAVPLAAAHFGLFSPYGAPLTLLILPLVVAAIVPAYVSLAVAWAAPDLSYALAAAAEKAAAALAWAVRSLAGLPGLHFELRPVDVVWVTAWYAALAVVVCHRRLRRGRAWAVAAAGGVLALTVYTQRPAPPPQAAELHVLAVGAGQCAVLRVPAGRTYVLDAGSLSAGDCGERVLVPFLLHERLPTPTAAIVSHANTDHYNALPALLTRGYLPRVCLNEYFGRVAGEPGSRAAADLMAAIGDAGARVVRLRPGQTLRLDDRTEVEVLWPPPGRTDLTANDRSLVLRVTCDGRSVLLPGDLADAGQAELADQPRRVRSDVLIAPHHGGWKDELPDFVGAVAPSVVILSGAREPTGPAGGRQASAFYGHLRSACRYYSTPTNGYIRLHFSRHGIHVRTLRP